MFARAMLAVLLLGAVFCLSSCASGAKKSKMSKQYAVGTMQSPRGVMECPGCGRRYKVEFEY